MTDAVVHTGYPILEMASHASPYRTVLAPPPEFGIDWRRVGTMLAAALRESRSAAPERAVAVRTEAEHTVFARSRRLESAEVGADQPVTDRSSRPIVVTEGVVFVGRLTGDPETVLHAARSQFARVIQEYWNDSGEFHAPRFSEPVTCRLSPPVVTRAISEAAHKPVPLTQEDGKGPDADEPPRVGTVATPPAARRHHLLPVLVVLLILMAVVVLVAVDLSY